MRKNLLKRMGILFILFYLAMTSSFADGKTLLSEIKPYATTGYYWAFEGKQSSLLGGSYSMTMMGEKYPDGFKFGEPGTAIFNLGKKYVKISGVVGLDDFENKKDTAVSFYADNQLVEYIDLKAFTAPIPFEINVNGVTQLRIVKEKGYSEVDFAQLKIEDATEDDADRSDESESSEGGSYLVKEMEPYATTGYYWAFGQASSSKLGGDKSMTMGGVRYHYGFKFGAPGTATYSLNGKYEILTGTIGLDDFENKKDTGVEFVGDGITLASINLPAYTLPQSFSVDVSGVRKLEIIKTPGYSEVDLAELKVYEGDVESSVQNTNYNDASSEVEVTETARNGTDRSTTQQNTNTIIANKEPDYSSGFVTKIKTVATSNGPSYAIVSEYASTEYDDVYYMNNQYITGGAHGIIKTSADGKEWRTLSTGQFDAISGLSFGQGTYLATTDTGKLLKSVDLETWTILGTDNLTPRFYGIEYFNSAFYALAENGVIFKSSNGQTFEKVAQIENAGPNTYTIFRAIKTAGSKIFVLSEGYAYASENGSDWNRLDLKVSVVENGQSRVVDMTNFYDVIKGGNLYLLASDEEYFTSTDGVLWQSHRIDGYSIASFKKILALTYINDTFQLYVDEWLQGSVDERYIIRVGLDGSIIQSSETQRTDLEGNKIIGAVSGTSGIVAVGSDILYSADGNEYHSQLQRPNNRALLSEVNGYYFLAEREKMIVFSRNGFITSVSIPFTSSQDRIQDVTYGNGIYVAVGDKQTILISSDLITWNEALLESQKIPDVNMRQTISKVMFYGGKFIAMDYSGQVYTSIDGSDWVVENLKSGYGSMILKGVINGKLTAIGFYEKRTAAGGYEGDYGLVLTSMDGINWTEHTLRGTDWISDIAYKNGMYVVAGQAGTFAISSDLEAWAVYAFDPMSEIMTQTGAYANILQFAGLSVYNNTFYLVGTAGDGVNPSSSASQVYQIGNSLSVYRPGDNNLAMGKKNSGFILSSTDGLNWSWTMSEMRLPISDLDQVSGKLIITLEDGQILLLDHLMLP